MRFQAFSDIRRVFTSEVVWSRVVKLKGGGRVYFRLKRKHDRLRVEMALGHPFNVVFYQMELRDLQKMEAALLATKNVLYAAKLDELARRKEEELARLQFVIRTWRRITDTDLWKKDVSVGEGTISFCIATDRHAYIAVDGGEGASLPLLRDLEAMEDALRCAMTAMQPIDRGKSAFG